MRKIILHIGFGKTGSSALQTYLSANPLHVADDLSLIYCCLEKDGSVISGEQVTLRSRQSPLRYTASILDPSVVESFDRTKADISALLDEGHTPFFSQENWGRLGAKFQELKLLEKIDCRAEVVVYVRPQVEWFNSGWWQWWAWTEGFERPEEVFARWGYKFICWAQQIERWIQAPGVDKVSVRLHGRDIVRDCVQLLGITTLGDYPEANVSLSPTLIKLLLKFPELRQTHSSDVDIILTDLFRTSGHVPWIVTEELTGKILEATRSDNQELAKLFDAPSRERMQADPRWWDKTAFSDRKVWSREELELQPSETEELLRQALPSLISMSRRLARTQGP